jgi:hypothetical protein
MIDIQAVSLAKDETSCDVPCHCLLLLRETFAPKEPVRLSDLFVGACVKRRLENAGDITGCWGEVGLPSYLHTLGILNS